MYCSVLFFACLAVGMTSMLSDILAVSQIPAGIAPLPAVAFRPSYEVMANQFPECPLHFNSVSDGLVPRFSQFTLVRFLP